MEGEGAKDLWRVTGTESVAFLPLAGSSSGVYFTLTWRRFYTREEATNAVRYVSGTKLDERIIRTDWDTGFIEGRQYGRGKGGGQIR